MLLGEAEKWPATFGSCQVSAEAKLKCPNGQTLQVKSGGETTRCDVSIRSSNAKRKMQYCSRVTT